jgi:hypothetical protein
VSIILNRQPGQHLQVGAYYTTAERRKPQLARTAELR